MVLLNKKEYKEVTEINIHLESTFVPLKNQLILKYLFKITHYSNLVLIQNQELNPSSTSFDHAFSYNRNVYEEISSLVDEVFTTYITKSNIVQPLLVQYCDGRKTQCPGWLLQWESKELGDKMYDHIKILKNYYG